MSDFYINHDKFQDLSNKAADWVIQSFNFKSNSPEKKICLLKREIYMRDALVCLDEANKVLTRQLN